MTKEMLPGREAPRASDGILKVLSCAVSKLSQNPLKQCYGQVITFVQGLAKADSGIINSAAPENVQRSLLIF